MWILYVLLALAVVKSIWLYKVYDSVPAAELKRRARAGDSLAAKLYRVAAYEGSFDLLLWLAGTAAAAGLVIWSARFAWWAAAAAVVIIAWLVFGMRLSAEGRAGRLAALTAPFGGWLLGAVQPVLDPLAKRLRPAKRPAHTGLYDKKDLLNFLNRQNKQSDNRIDEHDLRLAFNALHFGDKTLLSVMTPRRNIKFVGTDETVGPMLMDELHKTGQSRFPVVKDSPKSNAPKVIGTLYLKDIIGDQAGGKVKDFVRKETAYINEDANLRQALEAFLESSQLMLIVVNNFNETAGLLQLEDVLAQITGRPGAQNVAN